jgi:hypothetical protein
MPELFRVGFLKDPKNIILFLCTIAFLGTIIYFLNLRVNFTSKLNNTGLLETVYDVQGNQVKLKHKYPPEAGLPQFLVRNTMEVPKDFKANYGRFEYYGVRVVSTGKFSTVLIKNKLGLHTIAKVLQLEVKVDDKQDFFNNNQPFKIALRIYPNPDIDEDIAPLYLMNIIQQQESESLVKEISPSSVDELNQNLSETTKDYIDKGISQDKLNEMFREGTSWIIVPYAKDDLIVYTLQNKDAVNHEFAVLADQYYGGGDSKLIEKVLSKDFSNIKEPVMLSDLYFDYN